MDACRSKYLGPKYFLRIIYFTVKLKVVHVMLTLSVAGTERTVPVFMTACTEYHSGRIVDGEEAKNVLINCKAYNLVMLTVVEETLTLCFGRTAMSVSGAITPCTE